MEENSTIDRLKVSDAIKKILKENNIVELKQLCEQTRTDLKNVGLLKNAIKEVNIDFELLGRKLK